MKQILTLFGFLFIQLFFGQEYIQIIRPDINIRMEPSTSSPIVGHAFNGEFYICNGEELKWVSVILPSGETRWIYKKLTKKIQFTPSFPEDIDLIKVQEELRLAVDQANLDAEEVIVLDLKKSDIYNILFDRYSLIALQKFSVSPVFFDYITQFKYPSRTENIEPIADYLFSVSHVEYDLFKVDFSNIYIETKRCFKLGEALDAMVYMYYEGEQYIQQLCFEESYGKGFKNCYNIKNIYEAVIDDSNLVVLTIDGKMKKTNLVLRETQLSLDK